MTKRTGVWSITARLIFLAVVAAWIMAGFSTALWAETFTGAQFLAWPRANQQSYLHTSVGMAGLIARQNQPAQGDCIDNWYFKNQDGAYNSVVRAINRFASYHPRAIVLAVIEKKCGKLIYRRN